MHCFLRCDYIAKASLEKNKIFLTLAKLRELCYNIKNAFSALTKRRVDRGQGCVEYKIKGAGLR